MADKSDENLLEVEDLTVYYGTERGPVRAVEGATFSVKRGERFGLVGESGCGKSTTASAIMRLIRPPGYIQRGRILLAGRDLVRLPDAEIRRTRWRSVSLIPQGAMNSLNPVMRIRDQISDAIDHHEGIREGPDARERRLVELVSSVGLPGEVLSMYPHQLSGGMKQRVCIAMAIALNPELIIADEPTSALDVIVQRLVAQTLIDIESRLGASLILIGHDMGLQAQLVDRLAVMYAGRVMEIGDVRAMFHRPLHPYTQLLTSSLPSLKHKAMPKSIPGLPPSLFDPPPGCVFHPRCPQASDVCRVEMPSLREPEAGRWVSCHLC